MWIALFPLKAEIYRWTDEHGRVHYSDRPIPSASLLSIRPGYSYSRVRRIYDGDTLALQGGEKVRLLGINTPELENSKRAEEKGAQEAKARLQNLIGPRKVRLEKDVIKRDKYDRLLAHVFTEDGVHVNRVLVEEGLATVNIHPPNLHYAEALLKAQQKAEREGRGIWSRPAYAPRPIQAIAANKVRGWQRLRGKPSSISKGRRYVYLNFADRIDVRIPRENLPLFPDLENYLHQDLEVRGWASRRHEHYFILIEHPSALIKLGSSMER